MKKFLVAAVALSILLTGCTGPFALTKKVHEWQTNVHENQWVEEITFLGCSIFVYGPTVFIDSIIFNSIEFWGGDNPIDSAQTLNGDELCLRSVAAQM